MWNWHKITWYKCKENFPWTGIAILLFFIGTGNALLTGFFLFREGKLNFSGLIDPTLADHIGTYLAGTSGTLWGAAGLIVLIQTLSVQQEGLRQQKEVSKQQSFETTFFNSLSRLEKCTQNLSSSYKNSFSKQIIKAYSYNYTQASLDIEDGDLTPNEIGINYYDINLDHYDIEILDEIESTYVIDYEEYLARQYYNILEFVNEHTSKPYIYYDIISESFSSEITALFYYFAIRIEDKTPLELIKSSDLSISPRALYCKNHIDLFKKD